MNNSNEETEEMRQQREQREAEELRIRLEEEARFRQQEQERQRQEQEQQQRQQEQGGEGGQPRDPNANETSSTLRMMTRMYEEMLRVRAEMETNQTLLREEVASLRRAFRTPAGGQQRNFYEDTHDPRNSTRFQQPRGNEYPDYTGLGAHGPGVNVIGERISGAQKAPVFTNEGTDTDWAGFRCTFLDVAKGHGWSHPQAITQLRAAMRGNANRAMRTIDMKDVEVLDEALALLEEIFLPETASARAQAQFHVAKQKSDEEIENWHNRLLSLFVRAYPKRDPKDDPDLIRVFALGMHNEKVLYETRNANSKTYREALRAAQRCVSTLEEIKNRKTHGAGTDKPGTNALLAMEPSDPHEELLAAIGVASCYECKEPGHFIAQCPKLAGKR